MYSTHYSTRRDKIIVKGVKKLDCQKYCKMRADFQLAAWDANHSCFVFGFFFVFYFVGSMMIYVVLSPTASPWYQR